jgi:hypothetical protein
VKVAEVKPIIIEQIGGERLSLTLEGAALPDAGVDDEIEQRTTVDWYRGAKTPHVYIDGVKLEPMEFRGDWDVQNIGAQAVTENHQTLRTMVAAGIPVTLTWGDIWQRRGVLNKYKATHHGNDRIAWTLTIAIYEAEVGADPAWSPGSFTVSSGEGTQALARKYAARVASDRAVTTAAAGAAFAKVVTAGAQSSIADGPVAAMEQIGLLMAQAVDKAQNASDPRAVRDARVALESLRAQCDAAVHGVFTLDTNGLYESPTDKIDGLAWESASRISLLDTQMAAITELGGALAMRDSGGEVEREHLVISGETWFTVARDELGDWSQWQRVVAANAANPGDVLVAGTRLRIPPANGADVSSGGAGRAEARPLMDLDVAMPGSGRPIGITPTGDVALIGGDESLRRWVVRAALTTPGDFPSLPTFGAGCLRHLSDNAIRAASGIKTSLERTMKLNPRIKTAKVSAALSQTAPGRINVTATITTRDDRTTTAAFGL